MDFLAPLTDLIIKLFAAVIILAHMVVGIFVSGLGYKASVAPAPAATVATTTTTTKFPTAKTASTTALPKKSIAAPAKAVSQKVAVVTPTPPVQTPQTTPAISQESLNTTTRAALVNILCTTQAGGSFHPISGSGVVVDSRGIVLTNAHVAQFFLLRDYVRPGNIQCVVRTGSPAQARYTAELLYLPPQWVADNASQLVAQQATGTGENDYAFLRITGTTSGGPLPSSLPYVPMDSGNPDLGDSMLLAAYPAGFLSGELTQTSLYASSAFAFVAQLFTFDDTKNVVLISRGGSVASQAGAAGGAVVRTTTGTLAGIIATATLADSTQNRDLRAITLGHIDRSLAHFGKVGIAALLSGDTAAKAADFNANVAPAETAKLEAVLNAQ